MEATMGRVTVTALVENPNDVANARAGIIPTDQVRSVQIDDALVDTGAKLLALPTRLIKQLGIHWFQSREGRTSVGVFPCNLYEAVWLTIGGRRCTVDVSEVPDTTPVLIGYIPLELLDFVVDPIGQRLIPNPEQGDRQILDLF